MATKTKPEKTSTKNPASGAAKPATSRTAKGEKLRKDALAEIGKRIQADPTDHSEQLGTGADSPVKPTTTPHVGPSGEAAPSSPADATSVPNAPAANVAKKGRTPKSAPAEKPKRMGGLDVAAQLLLAAAKPMSCKELVEDMLARKLWSTTGKTPVATIYAAIIRDIAANGMESRFRKTARGCSRPPATPRWSLEPNLLRRR